MNLQEKVDNIKLQLFSYAIGDIFKCIDGEALVATFLQCFCIIDYISYIRNKLPEKGNRDNYMEFIKDLLSKYNGEQLYAIRCALVHTYGHSETMRKAKLKGYSFTHKNSEKHLIYKNFILHLNLSDFASDVVKAAWQYFESLNKIKDEKILFDPITRGEELIKVFNPEGKVVFKENYGQIHPCLSPLDLNDWAEFRQKVHDLCLTK